MCACDVPQLGHNKTFPTSWTGHAWSGIWAADEQFGSRHWIIIYFVYSSPFFQMLDKKWLAPYPTHVWTNTIFSKEAFCRLGSLITLEPFLPIPIIQCLSLHRIIDNIHDPTPFGVKMFDEMDVRIKIYRGQCDRCG